MSELLVNDLKVRLFDLQESYARLESVLRAIGESHEALGEDGNLDIDKIHYKAKGYDNGYDVGYDEGHDAGYDAGHDEAYRKGYGEGWDEGVGLND